MFNQHGSGESDPGRHQQIVEAALRVFTTHGFYKATIKRIAQEAGLKSPALIYWYFPNKFALFEAVLKELSPFTSLAAEPAELLDHPPEKVLPKVARTYLSTFDNPNARRLFRIFMSEVIRLPEAEMHFVQKGPLKMLNFLAAYFQRQVELGRLRWHDTQSSARAYMGALVLYVMHREIFPFLAAGLPDPDHYVEELLTIFLHGLCPLDGTSNTPEQVKEEKSEV